MTIVAWVLQGVLAVFFLVVGGMKIVRDRKQLADAGMLWATDLSAPSVRAIGVLEVLGALGLVLPTLLGIVPVLTPLAAVGLALVMVGAVVVHLRRGEVGAAGGSLAVGVLLLAVAVLRFGPLG